MRLAKKIKEWSSFADSSEHGEGSPKSYSQLCHTEILRFTQDDDLHQDDKVSPPDVSSLLAGFSSNKQPVFRTHR